MSRDPAGGQPYSPETGKQSTHDHEHVVIGEDTTKSASDPPLCTYKFSASPSIHPTRDSIAKLLKLGTLTSLHSSSNSKSSILS